MLRFSKLIVFFVLALSIKSIAQDEVVNDEKIKTQALAQVGLGLRRIENLNTKEDKCTLLSSAEATGGPGLKFKSCQQDVDKIKKEINFVLEYNNYEEIPNLIKSQLPVPEKSLWSRKYTIIMTANELGVSSVGHFTTGDDKGFTVGSSVAVGATYDSKIDVKVSLTGNLYTYEIPRTRKSAANGEAPTASQLYRNETILEIMASSQRAGKLSYWDARAGAVKIAAKEEMGLLDGSWQQREFHKFLNKQGMQNTNYTNIDDKKGDKYGAYVGAMVGLQQSMRLSKNCMINGRLAVGGSVSNLPEHLYAQATAGLDARYSLKTGSILAGVEATKIKHLGGNLTDTTLKLAYENKNYEAGVSVTKHDGQLLNGYRRYNLPNLQNGLNDSTISAYVKVYNK